MVYFDMMCICGSRCLFCSRKSVVMDSWVAVNAQKSYMAKGRQWGLVESRNTGENHIISVGYGTRRMLVEINGGNIWKLICSRFSPAAVRCPLYWCHEHKRTTESLPAELECVYAKASRVCHWAAGLLPTPHYTAIPLQEKLDSYSSCSSIGVLVAVW